MSMTEASKTLRAHWVAYLIEGIVLVILGAAAILIPPLATLAVWAAPGSEDTKLGVLMEPEVRHGAAEVYAGVQA
jgi:uncharacterized membrane protein HdeD (DUF308 family)